MKILIYGHRGYIASHLIPLLEKEGHKILRGLARLENRDDIDKEISLANCDRVINLAGITGRPNIDWCEINKETTVRVNVIGFLNLIDLCVQKKVHLTIFNTGCIYNADYQEIYYTEEDEPNFTGSFYSLTKGMVDKIIKTTYPQVLNLRIRLPISCDSHERNVITKLTKYNKVIDVPNSCTVLEDLLPISVDMINKKITGTHNFVNPGAISPSEIMGLYKKYVDPKHEFQVVTLKELSGLVVAKRSNCRLSCKKLLNLGYYVPQIAESIEKIMKNLK